MLVGPGSSVPGSMSETREVSTVQSFANAKAAMLTMRQRSGLVPEVSTSTGKHFSLSTCDFESLHATLYYGLVIGDDWCMTSFSRTGVIDVHTDHGLESGGRPRTTIDVAVGGTKAFRNPLLTWYRRCGRR